MRDYKLLEHINLAVLFNYNFDKITIFHCNIIDCFLFLPSAGSAFVFSLFYNQSSV